jgi:hypothetical protein
MSEAASIADTVSASWGTSAAMADSASISDSESYPTGRVLAQTMYRGRNAVIWWRQPETPAIPPVFYADSVAESAAASDATDVSAAAYAGSVGEALGIAETIGVSVPVIYVPGGGGHPHKPPKKPKTKRDEDDEQKDSGIEKAAEVAAAPKPASKKRKLAKQNELVTDKEQEQIDRDEEEAIRRLLTQLLS